MGRIINLSSLRGNVVLIDFFGHHGVDHVEEKSEHRFIVSKIFKRANSKMLKDLKFTVYL